jgi:hypothetical protein
MNERVASYPIRPDIAAAEMTAQVAANETDWLSALRRYLLFVALANLIWEFAHMPLYTIASTGTTGEILFAGFHCTGGDILIALSSIMLALFIFGDRRWPEMQLLPVVWLTVLFGTGYAIVSEWLNITVRKAWAYSDLMPVVPLIDTGLSPLLRWIVIPLGGFWWASRMNPQPLEKTL